MWCIFLNQVLQTFIKACLTETQNQKMTSIAFPAMGTGNLGYPRDMVAEEMCSCIVNFSKDNPKTCVKNVSFVIYEKDIPTIQVGVLNRICAFDNEVI